MACSRQTLGRELRAMGFRRLSARPKHYGQDADAQEAFKNTSPIWSPPSAPGTAGHR
ncbi:MAG: winged helix-turn-helix domain-containing protein [Paracoccaceae bacterium]